VPDGIELVVSSGMLPTGVTLAAAGPYLLGEPTTRQMVDFTLTASDPAHGSGTSSALCAIEVRNAPTVTRIAGSDRYTQAVAVSSKKFSKADTVFVASGEKFADALSATAIAADRSASLLLTPRDSIPPAVLTEISRLAPVDVVVVGGEASISAAVMAQIDAATDAAVRRVGGADRYEVSRNLISDPDVGPEISESVYLATGATFPDALTASPAAASVGAPVLLIDGREKQLTETVSALLDRLGVTSAFIAGGPNSVSAELESTLTASFTTARFTGADRFAVGVAINKRSFESAPAMYLASGTAFPDALSGGVAAGREGNPLYVTPSNCLTNEVYAEIGRLAPGTVFVLGGTATLSVAIETLQPCGLD
jgi:putative cell wall-binding protein